MSPIKIRRPDLRSQVVIVGWKGKGAGRVIYGFRKHVLNIGLKEFAELPAKRGRHGVTPLKSR